MSIASIQREIRAEWPTIVERAQARHVLSEAGNYLPNGSIRLLGSATKTAKGEGIGVLTAVVYLSPADEAFAPHSSMTLCPFAGDCAAACLGHSAGRMIQNPNRRARLWKTALFMGSRRLFYKLLVAESWAHVAKAKRLGMVPAIRVDGSSDTGAGKLLAGVLQGEAQVYDYTKDLRRARAALTTAHYHAVYSYSERSCDVQVSKLLRQGGTVAMVFDTPKGQPLPETWRGFRVIDGDLTDARFLDPAGVVVGLRFKSARNRDAGLDAAGAFVQPADGPYTQAA